MAEPLACEECRTAIYHAGGLQLLRELDDDDETFLDEHIFCSKDCLVTWITIRALEAQL